MTALRKGVFWITLAVLVSCLAKAQEPAAGQSLGEIARAYRAKKQGQTAAPVRQQPTSAVFRRWSEMSPSTPAKFAGRPDNVKGELAEITPVIATPATETAGHAVALPLVAVKAATPK